MLIFCKLFLKKKLKSIKIRYFSPKMTHLLIFLRHLLYLCKPNYLCLCMYNVSFSGKLYSFSGSCVMGIVNVSPDSFYVSSAGSDILTVIDRHLSEGVQIIDLGGCSTRPNVVFADETEEWNRVSKALTAIRDAYPDVIVSLDTFRASVAQRAVEIFGVQMINDISGGQLDADMFPVAGSLGVPYILTHYRTNPSALTGSDFMSEVIDYFQRNISCLTQCGVKDIILDPGFGFGKTLEQNYLLLGRLSELKIFGLPILAGVSHKSMIYRLLGTDAAHAGNGTTVCETAALLAGADIIRTHNVRNVADAIKITEKLRTLDIKNKYLI